MTDPFHLIFGWTTTYRIARLNYFENRVCVCLTTLLLAVAPTVANAADTVLPAKHFSATTPTDAERWQQESRKLLFDLLKLSDLQATRQPGGTAVAFDVEELSSKDHDRYVEREIEFNSTPARRIKAVLTIPKPDANAKSDAAPQKHPAVVCIHGHGDDRKIVYNPKSLYNGFAAELAKDGYVTISTDVGQHEVYEEGRSLMGERLWDVLRCADYVATLPEVDTDRMGCAGLSLGGEMAMWLGAMDPRMKATVSSGFLTTVANMRNKHCPCWDFPRFTENFEFSDIYSLTAPRALLCQVGQHERAPGGFPVEIAQQAMTEIGRAYAAFNAKQNVQLDTPAVGHVYVVKPAHEFLKRHLR